jgi:signal transduction histidine kinase
MTARRLTMSRGESSVAGRSSTELLDELRASEARFREVIERNADAIVVVDTTGTVLYANPMAERLFDRDGAELLGTTLGFPLVAGETTELDVLSHAGPRVAEMRVVESRWDGCDAYIASLRDITERKQAERDARRLIREQEARRTAEELAGRQRFLLEGSAALVATLDYDATLTTLARLCVSGVADWAVVFCTDKDGHPERVEVAHRDPQQHAPASALRALLSTHDGVHPIVESFNTNVVRRVDHVDAAVLDTLCHNSHEAELVRELGADALLLLPMVARGRQIGGLVLVRTGASHHFDEGDEALAEDIAVRGALALDNARLYDDARRADKERSDLLAVVSHDLRTPLTAIMGYAELLRLGIPKPLPPESMTQVERIGKSAQHLLYLMNELLTFTRLDAGHETVNVQEVDVRDLVREVAVLIEPVAREHGLTVDTSLPAQPVPVRTDPDKLRQVLLNLAGNAVKYTPAGSVHLRLAASADGAVLRVEDTGVGISAENLTRIYEPFWQVDPSQRSREGGTGLGLSIVRRMVDLLGGRVEVESRMGEGTTFKVTVASA